MITLWNLTLILRYLGTVPSCGVRGYFGGTQMAFP